ncbi:diaminopimelate epimerase [Candidatus Vidania fulgoroideorum]
MLIRFIKVSSYGNDFMLISKKDITKREIYNRKIGIGFDQKLSIKHLKKNIFRCIIRNKDITEANNCFNGLRCIFKYLNIKTGIRKIYILTKKGSYKLTKKEEKVKTILKKYSTNFTKNIRFLYKEMFFRNILFNIKQINLLLKKIYFNYIDIGNLHIIILSNRKHKYKVKLIKKIIEDKLIFKKGVNISIFNIENKKIKTFERGSGITLSCGTGTMACCITYTMGMEYKKILIPNNLGRLVFKKTTKCLSTIGEVCFSYSGKIVIK